MLLQLKTGRVEGYTEGQEPLVYLKTTAQAVYDAGVGFVFSDGHGLAAYTSWFDDLADLVKLDWSIVYQQYWADNKNDMDRQRRKQAEFLVHRFCDWSLIQNIVVINDRMEKRIEKILSRYPLDMHRSATVQRDWYY